MKITHKPKVGVTFKNNPLITYQWRFNGVRVLGACAKRFTMPKSWTAWHRARLSREKTTTNDQGSFVAMERWKDIQP